MSNYPSLVSEYIQYVNYKSEFEKTSKIDLSDMQFVFPTTLLPLSGIILKNKDKYIPPKSHKVENYISTILNPHHLILHTRTPPLSHYPKIVRK